MKYSGKIPSIITSDKNKLDIWNEHFPVVFSDQEEIQQKDILPFTSFVCLLHQQNEAIEAIALDGMYYDSADNNGKLLKKVHPAHKVFADSARMLIPYYNRFGLSEYDRKTNEKRFPQKKEIKKGKFADIGM